MAYTMKFLRMRRKMLGVSPTTLAKAIGVGYSQYVHYETGRNVPHAGKAMRLAKMLDCSIDDLMADKCPWPEHYDIFLGCFGGVDHHDP